MWPWGVRIISTSCNSKGPFLSLKSSAKIKLGVEQGDYISGAYTFNLNTLFPISLPENKRVVIHLWSAREYKATEMASSWSRTLKNLALFSSWAQEKNFPTCKQWLFRLCPKGAHQSNWHKCAWADSQTSDKISFISPFECHCIEIPEGWTFDGQGTKPKPSVTMSWALICQSRTAVKQHIRYAQLTPKSCHKSRPM